MKLKFSKQYIMECKAILNRLDDKPIEEAIRVFHKIRSQRGRLFIMGSGGGAGQASHAVNDFRKITSIESYCPSDNVSELTARINDDGWATSYANYLRTSLLGPKDGVLIFSVGGGCKKQNISMNLICAMELAKKRKAKIIAVTGRDGGEARRYADVLILVPTVEVSRVTPHTESFQAIIWHLIVSHPKLIKHKTKW